MKSIISILALCFLLVSCGGNSSAPKATDTSKSQTVQESPIVEKAEDCESSSEAAKLKLLEANENPDVALEFLGSAETDKNCFLKVKITQIVGLETAEVFSLFDTATEQSYANYTDEQQMDLALIELKK